jgi:Transposase DDE domain
MAAEIYMGLPWRLPRKRALTELVNDKLKNIYQIEHSHHRSIFDFLVNILAGLRAYTYHDKKQNLDLEFKDWQTLPPARF